MKAILKYQEVAEIVEDEFQVSGEKATKKMLYRENKKYDCKVTILLHQCVDDTQEAHTHI